MSVLEITKKNFEEEVLKSEKPVLVDFWAPWCGPCKMIIPIIDEVAKEATNAQIGKINVDVEQELASSFKIMSIPTLIVFKNGKEVKRVLGVKTKDEIIKMLEV